MVRKSGYTDITGRRKGKLVALNIDHFRKSKQGKNIAYWKFQCDCGNTTVAERRNVQYGNISSCGCLRSEMMREKQYRHGGKDRPIYTSFLSMKQRCYNPKNQAYHNYGGRGITVCDRWLEPNGQGFLNFLEDMGERPSDKHSLDRIDNDGNYTQDNCRWATRGMQGFNRRLDGRNKSGHRGVHWDSCSNKWKATIGYKGKEYYEHFTEIQDAIDKRREFELQYYGVNKL